VELKFSDLAAQVARIRLSECLGFVGQQVGIELSPAVFMIG
jgi:hypothetical protein